MKTILALIIALLCTASLSAQNSSSPANIKLFLDCQWGCDFDYFRQELKYVDIMRDRQEAEVFMQLIRQRSGNGGTKFSLQITGQELYTGMLDTLTFFINPEDGESKQRKAILSHVQKGLLPYIVKSAWADRLTFDVEVPTQEEGEAVVEKDPWGNWVFRINANGFFRGESSFSNSNINTRVTASKVTAESKFFLSASLNNNRTKFELSSGTQENKNNSKNLYLLYVKSLSDHWSAGGFASAGNSDFSNIKSSYAVKPAIEYSVFPYSENTTREFKILYRIGLVHNDYTEITTFDVTKQDIVQQNIDIEYKIIKDWGSIGIDFGIDNYPRDIKESNISFGPELEWNVFKGFSLSLYSRMSYIADRINITKASLSDEEILLGIRQLDSSFSYFGHFGVSYRFGSQTNNIVNTRF